MVFSIALLLTFISMVFCGPFDQIQQRITATGILDQNSLGTSLSQQLNMSLQSARIKALNCTFEQTSTTLTAQCQSMFWQSIQEVKWTIWIVSSDSMAIGGQFTTKQPMPWIVSKITKGIAAPSFVNDVISKQPWDCMFASKDNGPLGIAAGHYISSPLVSLNLTSTLFKYYQRIIPKNTDPVNVVVSVPVYSAQPTAISLSVLKNGLFIVDNKAAVTALKITVVAPTNTYSTDIQFFCKIKTSREGPGYKILYFNLTGNLVAGPVTLTGALVTPWPNPLGAHWITNIDSATLQVSLGDQLQLNSIIITAKAEISFSPSPVDIIIDISGTQGENVLFAIENINCNKRVAEIYTDLTGKKINSLSQVNINGSGNIAISTYDTPRFKQGITFEIDAYLTEGPMKNAAKKLNPTSQTFEYVFTVYFPEGNIRLDVTLAEVTPYRYSSKMDIDSYQYILDIGGGDKIELEAKITTHLHDGQDLMLDLTATLAEGSGLTLVGTTSNQWNHPLGMKWLSINPGATVNLNIDSTVTFQMHGEAALSWSPGSDASLDIQIGGAQFEENMISFSNVPIATNTLDKIIHEITGKNFVEVQSMQAQGTYGITLATYDSANGANGLTFKSHVQVIDKNSAVYKALNVLHSQPSTLVFDISLYIPIFTNPIDIQFDLTETGSFKFNKKITITDYGLHVHIGQTYSVTAGMDMTFHKTPFHFATSMEFNQQAASFTFEGDMTGIWNNPFGCKWLSVDEMKLTLTLGVQQAIQQFDVMGRGNYTWSPVDTGTAMVAISTSNDFTDDQLEFKITNKWQVYTIVKSIAGNGVSSYVQDIQSTHNLDLDFVISTSSGLTLSLDAAVTGDLKSVFSRHLYIFPNKPGDSYHLFVNVPIFSSNPLGITLGYSETENTQVSKHLWFQGFKFQLSVMSKSVSLEATAIGKWNSQPDLTFWVSGAFSADAGLLLSGAMLGTWVDAFHIKGFNLSNAIAEIGFSPAACSYGCLSDLGLGASFNIGKTIVGFDGNLAAPDYYNCYLSGFIQRPNSVAHSRPLGLPDRAGVPDPTATLPVVHIVQQWNDVNPNAPVPTNDLPETWKLTYLSFYLAAGDGTFGPIHFTKGFGITAKLLLLQTMTVAISLNCSGDSYTCNWAFNCQLSISEVEKLILGQIKLIYPPSTWALNPTKGFENNATYTFFKLHDVKLHQWSQEEISQGKQPRWDYSMTIFNSDKQYGHNCQQGEMDQTFSQYFHTYLKHLF